MASSKDLGLYVDGEVTRTRGIIINRGAFKRISRTLTSCGQIRIWIHESIEGHQGQQLGLIRSSSINSKIDANGFLGKSRVMVGLGKKVRKPDHSWESYFEQSGQKAAVSVFE